MGAGDRRFARTEGETVTLRVEWMNQHPNANEHPNPNPNEHQNPNHHRKWLGPRRL